MGRATRVAVELRSGHDPVGRACRLGTVRRCLPSASRRSAATRAAARRRACPCSEPAVVPGSARSGERLLAEPRGGRPQHLFCARSCELTTVGSAETVNRATLGWRREVSHATRRRASAEPVGRATRVASPIPDPLREYQQSRPDGRLSARPGPAGRPGSHPGARRRSHARGDQYAAGSVRRGPGDLGSGALLQPPLHSRRLPRPLRRRRRRRSPSPVRRASSSRAGSPASPRPGTIPRRTRRRSRRTTSSLRCTTRWSSTCPARPFAPSLAESYEVAPDFKSATFKLRPNIKFHDGSPVTPDDVKFTYMNYRGANAKILHDKLDRIDAPDDRTVKFFFKEPFVDFMMIYGSPSSGAGWIVPKAYYEKVGKDGFKNNPIGAGPYRFVKQRAGSELELEAFTDYWRKVPSIKTLIFLGIPEVATRFAVLKTGEVDAAYAIQGDLFQTMRQDPEPPGGGRPGQPDLAGDGDARQSGPSAQGRPGAAGDQPGDRPQGGQRRRAWRDVLDRRQLDPAGLAGRARPARSRPPTSRRRSSCWPRPASPTASTSRPSRRCRRTSPGASGWSRSSARSTSRRR